MRALCLDLTRLTRRAALPQMTGIDRVEKAYLRHLLGNEEQVVFGLVRAGRRLYLLDRAGMSAFLSNADDPGAWGKAGWMSLFSRRPKPVLAAEAGVARLSIASAPAGMAAESLRSVLPPDILYLNTGHSNLGADIFGAIAAVPGAESVVFVHDTIPLDYPEFQRRGTPETFRAKLDAVSANAQHVIVPSQHVADRFRHHTEGQTATPDVLVAPLGIDFSDTKSDERFDAANTPYFVSVGTIEPRKNHALLLDLWDSLPGPDRPTLYLVGRRGWRNSAVFARLDRGVPDAQEIPDLDDTALGAMLSGAAGLLHPSHAEGFGLPPHEAAARGVIPVCAPLPVYKETLGDVAIYAEASDLYQWKDAVMLLAERWEAGQAPRDAPLDGYNPPTWEQHFKVALTTIC